MRYASTKEEAIIEALDMLGGIAIVDQGPKYLIIKKYCANCKYLHTAHTGECVYPMSSPCDKWESGV